MQSVAFGLYVFVSVLTRGDNNPNRFPVDTHKEPVGAIIDTFDGYFLGEFPACSIGVEPSNAQDSHVWIGPITLVNAHDLECC